MRLKLSITIRTLLPDYTHTSSPLQDQAVNAVMETGTVYCDNCTKHTKTLSELKPEMLLSSLPQKLRNNAFQLQM
jgi:hypothetical protein